MSLGLIHMFCKYLRLIIHYIFVFNNSFDVLPSLIVFYIKNHIIIFSPSTYCPSEASGADIKPGPKKATWRGKV